MGDFITNCDPGSHDRHVVTRVPRELTFSTVAIPTRRGSCTAEICTRNCLGVRVFFRPSNSMRPPFLLGASLWMETGRGLDIVTSNDPWSIRYKPDFLGRLELAAHALHKKLAT